MFHLILDDLRILGAVNDVIGQRGVVADADIDPGGGVVAVGPDDAHDLQRLALFIDRFLDKALVGAVIRPYLIAFVVGIKIRDGDHTELDTDEVVVAVVS